MSVHLSLDLVINSGKSSTDFYWAELLSLFRQLPAFPWPEMESIQGSWPVELEQGRRWCYV